jgi:hypothetical protein
MIKFTPNQTIDAWCLYTLANEQGEAILVWYCKFANVLAIQDALSNPNFNRNAPVTLRIGDLYNSRIEASNAVGKWMRERQFTPSLNRTIRASHYAPVKCMQTGQVFRNASEASRITGVNQSQLSQHLRGNPSNKTVRGLTFGYIDGKEFHRSYTQTPPVVPYAPTQQFEQKECFTHHPKYEFSDWDEEN